MTNNLDSQLEKMKQGFQSVLKKHSLIGNIFLISRTSTLVEIQDIPNLTQAQKIQGIFAKAFDYVRIEDLTELDLGFTVFINYATKK